MEYSNRLSSIVVPIGIIYNSLMVFYSILPRPVVMAASFVVFISLFYVLNKHYSIYNSLLLMAILMIPTSFVSVLGSSYSELPLTWHNLCIILLMLYIVFNRRINKRYFFLFVVFFIFGIGVSLTMPDMIDALKQLLTIELFICTFIIGTSGLSNKQEDITEIGWKCYFSGTIAVALQVLLQRAFLQATGIVVGHYIVAGVSRACYAGLLGDYSFATLYLATGCMYALVMHLSFKKMRFFKFALIELFLFMSMIVVSSRTGLIALAVTMAIYFVANFKRFNIRYVVLGIVAIIVLPWLASILMESRGGGQALLDSSGRLINYSKALTLFTDKPFMGYGFGLNNLYNLTGLKVPHNFFIQYLIQLGIVGTVLITIPFIDVLKFFSSAKDFKWIYLLVCIGAMVIPDIVSSRYLFGIVVLIMLSRNEMSEGERGIVSYET